MAVETTRIPGYPEVNKIRTFLQIAKDFTKPFDAIREAISNAMDAKAKNIYISAWEDLKMPGGELVIEVVDDGEGMTEDSLKKFFNLGDSTRVDNEGIKVKGYIGDKGHGTKTYFNSREIEVFTRTADGDQFYAVMYNPLLNLLQNKEPMYEYEKNPSMEIKRGTKVIIRGFNQNVKRDFSHNLLRDRMQWFTAFSDFSWVFEEKKPKQREDSQKYANGPKLYLHGLDRNFGHDWPSVSAVQKELTEIRKNIDKKSPELKGLDEPWSLGSLTKYDISPEALPAVMSVYRKCLAAEREFTIGEALWVARLHKLFDPPDPVTMLNWATAYALEEWVSEITGKESFNSEELDLEMIKDVHSTPEILRELEVWGIAEKYGADPVKLKDLNLSIEETEEIAKSGKYQKDVKNEGRHNQNRTIQG